jgi:hypothetical protein
MLVKTINILPILPAPTLHNNGFKLENLIDKYPKPHFMCEAQTQATELLQEYCSQMTFIASRLDR